jgi:hypothetical protein
LRLLGNALLELYQGISIKFLNLGRRGSVITYAIIYRKWICIIGVLSDAANVYFSIQSFILEVQVNALN